MVPPLGEEPARTQAGFLIRSGSTLGWGGTSWGPPSLQESVHRKRVRVQVSNWSLPDASLRLATEKGPCALCVLGLCSRLSPGFTRQLLRSRQLGTPGAVPTPSSASCSSAGDQRGPSSFFKRQRMPEEGNERGKSPGYQAGEMVRRLDPTPEGHTCPCSHQGMTNSTKVLG